MLCNYITIFIVIYLYLIIYLTLVYNTNKWAMQTKCHSNQVAVLKKNFHFIRERMIIAPWEMITNLARKLNAH